MPRTVGSGSKKRSEWSMVCRALREPSETRTVTRMRPTPARTRPGNCTVSSRSKKWARVLSHQTSALAPPRGTTARKKREEDGPPSKGHPPRIESQQRDRVDRPLGHASVESVDTAVSIARRIESGLREGLGDRCRPQEQRADGVDGIRQVEPAVVVRVSHVDAERSRAAEEEVAQREDRIGDVDRPVAVGVPAE